VVPVVSGGVHWQHEVQVVADRERVDVLVRCRRRSEEDSKLIGRDKLSTESDYDSSSIQRSRCEQSLPGDGRLTNA